VRGHFLPILAIGLATSAPARAADIWEGGPGDDTAASANVIGHGEVQVHDFDQSGGANDVDWVGLSTIAGHSYEARVSGATFAFDK
jgi:hypothetical protein